MRSSKQRHVRSKNTVPPWVVYALGAVLVLIAIAAAVTVFDNVQAMAVSWSGAGLPLGKLPPDSPQSTPRPGETLEPTAVATLSLDSLPEPWNGTDRVTILLMGLDFRDWLSDDGPPRTDTMMLVTLDPISRSAGMLSIPRDLWVEIPGFEHNRINTAYFLGETHRLPGGGPGLAMDTVEKLIGVPVDYYAVIEFGAFERMIDEIGGVDVWVEENIRVAYIDKDGRGHSKELEGGKGHHLNGADALAYARARKSEGGDFDRAQRQQQVALAIRDKVLGFDMIPTLVAKAPRLYQEIASGIYTNLSFDQLIALGMLALQVNLDEVERGVIAPPEMVSFESLPDGAQVLKPVPDKIRQLRDSIFAGTGAISPGLDGDPAEGARVEQARVRVLNGSGSEGLATETGDYLTQQGLNIVEVSNADRQDYDKSRLIVHNRTNPYTIRYLAALFGMTEGQILNPVNGAESGVDIVLILGADWAFADRP